MVYQFVMASYVQRTHEILSSALVGRQGNNILELTTRMYVKIFVNPLFGYDWLT